MNYNLVTFIMIIVYVVIIVVFINYLASYYYHVIIFLVTQHVSKIRGHMVLGVFGTLQ